ncbi:MAG: TRAP transporter small permease [Rhizobiaceae bacterium]
MGEERKRSVMDRIEETLIAILLGAMTLVTFANVVARYGFNSNILWALEATVFLFAWLVLLGASYCVKVNAHLGVDVLVASLSPGPRRALGLAAVALSLAFCVLLTIGAWQYWLPFAGNRAWYEVNDIQMPAFLQFLKDWMNEGERWEKLPRFIPYFALPLGMTLLTWRFVEAGWRIMTGAQDRIIAAHEAEDMVEEAAAATSGGER